MNIEPGHEDDKGAPVRQGETNEAHQQENGKRIVDVRRAVAVHAVIPEKVGDLFDIHSHGLEAFGHKEFQVLVPGFCRGAAADLVRDHADAVINRGDVFRPGDTVKLAGVRCAYEEVAGDAEGDPSRLRIVDIPGGCECETCKQKAGVERDGATPSAQPSPETGDVRPECVLPSAIRAAMARIDDQMGRIISVVVHMPEFPDKPMFVELLGDAWIKWGIPGSYDEREDRSEDLQAYIGHLVANSVGPVEKPSEAAEPDQGPSGFQPPEQN